MIDDKKSTDPGLSAAAREAKAGLWAGAFIAPLGLASPQWLDHRARCHQRARRRPENAAGRRIGGVRFTIIPYAGRRQRERAGASQCFLISNNWDDYSYKTTFTLICFNADGVRHDIGTLY